MRHNEHKRHKHGHLPGDIPKHAKIAMREGAPRADIVNVHGYQLAAKVSKTYRQFLIEKSRTQQRQRDRKIVAEEISESAAEGESNGKENAAASAPGA